MKYITKNDVSNWIPVRDVHTYKNKLGHILCIGGNKNMGGAIILSAKAALYAGAGLVTVASAAENIHALHSHSPEIMFTNMYDLISLEKQINKADVIVVGPGLGRDQTSKQIFDMVIQKVTNKQWLIIDADALFFYKPKEQKLNTNKVVLTPHMGEWQKLTSIKAPANDIQKNHNYSEQLNAIVILKKIKNRSLF